MSLLVEDCNFELFLKTAKVAVTRHFVTNVERYVCVCSMMSEDKKNSQRGMNVVVVNGLSNVSLQLSLCSVL